MSKILLSIITVCKNDYLRLCSTINSLSKFYGDINFEHIIVDGGFDQNTNILIRNIKKSNKIIYSKKKDDGIYDAMNFGVTLAKGKYIIFINCGDLILMEPYQIKSVLNKLDATKLQLLNFKSILSSGNQKINLYPKLNSIDKMSTSHQAMIFSKNIFNITKFSKKYKIAADFDLYLKMKNYLYYVETPNPLIEIEYGGISSVNFWKSYSEYFLIIYKNIDGFKKIYFLFKIALKFILISFTKRLINQKIYFQILKKLKYYE